MTDKLVFSHVVSSPDEPVQIDAQGRLKVSIGAKTVVVNFYGGPSSGKSVIAPDLYLHFKKKHKQVEYIQEYVKQWAWENRKPVSFDQFYFFGQQSRREYTKFGKADYLVTDSPVPLCAYFTKVYGTLEQRETLKKMALTYLGMCEDKGVEHRHFFVERKYAYDPQGRFQTEEEAIEMDKDQYKFFTDEMGLELHKIPGNEEGLEQVLLKL